MAKKKQQEFNINQRIGRRIRELRIANGYSSYEAFANEHNIHRAQMGRIENGSSDIRVSTLEKVINCLGVSMKDFFKDGFE